MLSERIRRMTPSATNVVNGMVTEMRARGEDVISFNVGEPDFDTPEVIIKAMNRAMEEGKTRYVGVAGIPELKAAIIDKLKHDNGIEYAPDQICISTGGKQVIFNTVMTLTDPGDEVIVIAPCWVSYVEMIKLAGGTPVVVDAAADYHLSIEGIRAAITDRTRAIIINTPNNPTGAVYTKVELTELASLAKENDLYIISDEIYEKLVYDDNKHVSIASISEDAYARTITVNGFAKAYCMTGCRIGYAAGPADVIKGIVGFQSHSTGNSTTFVQWGAVTALKECDREVEIMRKAFEERRNCMKARLDALTGFEAGMPEGAFYFMPDISYWFDKSDNGTKIGDAQGFAQYILRETGVAIVPGDAFEAPNAVRFAYPVSCETINEGMDRIEKALAALK